MHLLNILARRHHEQDRLSLLELQAEKEDLCQAFSRAFESIQVYAIIATHHGAALVDIKVYQTRVSSLYAFGSRHCIQPSYEEVVNRCRRQTTLARDHPKGSAFGRLEKLNAMPRREKGFDGEHLFSRSPCSSYCPPS